MSAEVLKAEKSLEWVLAKLSAKRLAPVYKPPEIKTVQPVAPKFEAKPVETEAQKLDKLKVLRSKEFDLWKRWKTGGQKAEDFEALLKSHGPILNRQLGVYAGAEVSKSAAKSVIIEHYLKALERFDPSKGASLTTWIYNNVKPVKRYFVKHQNFARITEPVVETITPFKTAQRELTQRLGYAPTLQQVVDHTHTRDWKGKKLSMKDAVQVQKLVKRGLDLGAGGEEIEGAGIRYNDPALQAAFVVYHQLKPHEQKVFDLLIPRDGSPGLKSGAIAKKLGWEVSKVSKAKKTIFSKIQERIGD